MASNFFFIYNNKKNHIDILPTKNISNLKKFQKIKKPTTLILKNQTHYLHRILTLDFDTKNLDLSPDYELISVFHQLAFAGPVRLGRRRSDVSPN